MLVLVAICFGAGCGFGSPTSGGAADEDVPNDSGPIVAIITDVSGSTKDLREPGGEYERAWLAAAKATAQARGSLWSTVADGETISSSTWLINGKGFKSSLEDNELLADGQVAKQAEDLLPEAKKQFATEGASGSDLLGALQVAQRLFADYPDRERDLVLLTDGGINKGGVRTSSTALKTESARRKAVRELKAQGLIPDLSGGGPPVRVWIGGLGHGISGGNPAKALQVISFWKLLIPAANGELISQDSSLRLVDFP